MYNPEMIENAVAREIPLSPDAQLVTSVTHYTDELFSFRLTRPRSLRFRSGEFVMIGLPGEDGKPILRPYSIASPQWDEELEFYSIKIENGTLTSKLQNIQVGDQVVVRSKAVGTLVLDALLPAKRIYLMSTGTGVAPFASLIRDPDLYQHYDEVILTHTCRKVQELEYANQLVENLSQDPLVGEEAIKKLKYYPTTTRQFSAKMGRITDLMRNGELAKDLGLPAINPATDRVMVCGSMGLNQEIKQICEAASLTEGSNSKPAEFVQEKAFVD